MEYQLKRSARSRALRLTVHPDGEVVVTAPRFFGLRAIEQFFAQHSGWVARKVEATKKREVIRIRRADIAALKKRTGILVRERAAHFGERYGVRFHTISIRAQKSRWGSCSQSGNLSFNYRIAALPAHVADYIVVHEVCHLLQMNHSKRFWDLVAQEMPAHKKIRKQLRNITFVFE